MEIVVVILIIAVGYLFTKATTGGVNSSPVVSNPPATLPPVTIVNSQSPTPIVQGATPTTTSFPSINIAPASQPQPPASIPVTIVPHLNPNASLLTDQSIATAESMINFSSGSRANFISNCLPMLAAEQITGGSTSTQMSKCASGGIYQGPPVVLTALKGGSLGLSFASSIGASLGGGIGSAAGLAGTGFAAAGTALGTAIPIIGIGIGAAISIFSAISQHHAAAVRNEQGLECKLIPVANECLNVLEQAVMSGTITPSQGASALHQLLSDFRTAATDGSSGQLTDKPGSVNAMGFYYHFLAAIITKKVNRYSNLVTT